MLTTVGTEALSSLGFYSKDAGMRKIMLMGTQHETERSISKRLRGDGPAGSQTAQHKNRGSEQTPDTLISRWGTSSV